MAISTPTAWIPELRAVLESRRERTHRLVAPLSEDEVHGQHVDFMSPIVWDMGHIANFEELWLLRTLADRRTGDARIDQLYNAFENPRWVRGELELLDRVEATAYLAEVRSEVLAELDRLESNPPTSDLHEDGHVHRMIAQHESQHQETVLQALALRGDLGPQPWAAPTPAGAIRRSVDPLERITIPGGAFPCGTDDRRWTYDNERPRHLVDVPTFAIDRFPVTCARYDAFIRDGGYGREELWSADGWAWLASTGHRHPQGWQRRSDGGWDVWRFGYTLELDPLEPVEHVSFFEAEAFAAWSGARLPTEFEWEKAAAWDPVAQTSRRYPWGEAPPTPARANVGLVRCSPSVIGAHPDGASPFGVEQMAGDVYEWTTSPFVGHPGFTAFPYPEYSEVFFGGDYRVLRGSSWAIAASMARVTYRNWDHPYRRQVFAGIRLAWDA